MTREDLIGKSVIGAMEVYNSNHELVEVMEILGQIMDINDEQGILICNHDTKKAVGLPQNFDAFKPAEKGIYTLNSGVKVKDPDLTCIMKLIRN